MSKYIRIVVSVLLLALIAWRTDWVEFGDKFANLYLEMWFAAVSLLMLGQIASARRWQLFARELQFAHSLTQYCAYYLIGSYFGLLLPTAVGGDVVRVWYLNGNSGRKWAAIASVFLERLNGVLILIAVACLGTLIAPVELPWWIMATIWGIAACAAAGLASVPMMQRWQRLSLQMRQQLRLFLELMGSRNLFVESICLSILVQVSGVLMLWCLGKSLGLDVPILYYCVLCPLVSLLMMLPLSIGGMGVRECGTVLLLAPLGVDTTTALSLAFLWFTVGVAVSLVGGVVHFFGTQQSFVIGCQATNRTI